MDFSTLTSDPRYPHTPTVTGHLDNFDSQANIGSKYGLRLWSYFEAPQFGKYVFVAACDDICKVMLSTNTDRKNSAVIITLTKGTGRYQLDMDK